MSRALSVDLRERVLVAVAAGATHRQAAERCRQCCQREPLAGFGPGAGQYAWPRALGGARIEAYKTLILSLRAATPDMTLEEMRQALAERGHVFGFGTLRRFFKRHRITRKKDSPCERAGAAGHGEASASLVRGSA